MIVSIKKKFIYNKLQNIYVAYFAYYFFSEIFIKLAKLDKDQYIHCDECHT
jgi:hypothetical protein